MKSRLIKLFIFIPVFLLSSGASANGNRVGNGGNVLICIGKNGKPTTRFFDFTEDGSERLVSVKSAAQGVNQAIARLQQASDRWARALKRTWRTMRSKIDWKLHVRLTKVNDSLQAYLPRHCRLSQIAIRREVIFGRQKRFVFNKTFFNRLQPVDRAGLYIHEMLYQYLHKLGASNSRAVRAVNRALFARKFNLKSLKRIIRKSHLPSY